jgi:hypothetical protein
MPQDFSRRMIIVVRKDVEGWQAMNAVAHSAAYFGNRLRERFDTGEFFVAKDNVRYPRNSQYPIIIKRANSNEQLQNLLQKVRATNIAHHAFIREMLDFEDDVQLQTALSQKSDDAVELLGVGIFGENEIAQQLTKKFGLWE